VASKTDASRLRHEALTTYEQLGAAPHASRGARTGDAPLAKERAPSQAERSSLDRSLRSS
jgi:hypothetical protein